MHRAGINHQATDALSRLPTDGHDTPELNDALPVLACRPLSSNDDAEDAETAYAIDEELDTSSSALPAVATPTTSKDTPSESTAKEFLHEQSKDLLCRSASSTVATPGSQFSYNRNGLLVRVAPIEGVVQKVFLRSLQAGGSIYFALPVPAWSPRRVRHV